MEILELRIQDVELDESNPRVTTEEQVELYKKILTRFGMIVPILITSENKILYDNGKYEAAKQLGMKIIRAVRIDKLSEDELRTLRLAELNAQEKGEWDFEKLYDELSKLNEDDLFLTGFNLAEIEKELGTDGDSIEEIEEIDIPEAREDYYSQAGDIYLLGGHRLMCGDSTSAEDVSKLMDGELADLMITDPPYNINYEGSDGQKIKNDNMNSNEFYEFLKKFYENAFNVMRAGAGFYIFHADSETKAFRGACEDAGFKISQCLIWVKNGFNLSRQDYNWRHEPCLYGWKLGKEHFFIKDYTQDTVLENKEILKKKSKEELLKYILELEEKLKYHSTIIEENKPTKNDIHPTMKPLKLLARLMANSSKKDWRVLDLFGGLGSTLMTAEQLQRKAYIMEYDPKYADVIVKRFASVNQNIKLLRNEKIYTWEEIKEYFNE